MFVESKRGSYLVIILILMMLSNNLFSEVYFVSTEGSDSNSGTQASPWKNLSFAVGKVSPGDTILMRGGVYYTNEIWIRGDRSMGGSNGRYLTIMNFPGETPSIGGKRRFIVSAPFVRIEGLSFRLPYRLSGGGMAFQVVNNTFAGPQPSYGAIEFFSDSGLIEDNRIKITRGGDTKDHGIYVHAGHKNIIRNNLIDGTSGYGIHVYDAVSSGGERAAIGFEDLLIENNLVMNSRYRSGIIISPGNKIEAKRIYVHRNIIVNNSANGIRLCFQSHDIEIYNNTIYGNGHSFPHPDDASAISIRDGMVRNVKIKNNIIETARKGAYHILNRERSPDIIIERNLYWHLDLPELFYANDKDPLYGDPLFIDAEGNDFHLQKSSPAVDAGINLGFLFMGASPDLGAFELIP